jgi:hypothetical protein
VTRLLSDVWLEGNPIEQDPYYKVKLLNCVPHLKNLDGSTVWRRTALQSSIVNDNLRYSDLCQRTPSTVDKYAQLSRRSANHTLTDRDSVLQNFSSSMLTLQALPQNSTAQTSTLSPVANGNISRMSMESGLRRLSDVTSRGDTSYAARNSMMRSVSPKPRRGPVEILYNTADISLLPAHLQEKLVKLRSPSARTARSRSTSPNNLVRGSRHTPDKGSPAASQVRARSSLPWRKPPAIAPNLELRFQRKKSDLSETQRSEASLLQGRQSRTPRSASREQAHLGSSVVSREVTKSKPISETPASGARDRAPPASNNSRLNASTASAVLHPATATDRPEPAVKPPATKRSPGKTRPEANKWMNPLLNPAASASGSMSILGPPPGSTFDSKVMELINNSSLLVLQKSFDADRRSVARRSSASLTPSAQAQQQRGRPRTRDEDRSLRRSASASGRSMASSTSPTGASRSVSQTRSSKGRSAFTAERLRATESARELDRQLVEARTYSRPTSPSPHRRNASYTIHQGTASNTPRSFEDNSTFNSTVYSFTSSKMAAFSPEKPAFVSGGSVRSASVRRMASPPRLNSTQRILEHYNQRESFPGAPETILELPMPKQSASPIAGAGRPVHYSEGRDDPRTSSNEMKGSPPGNGAVPQQQQLPHDEKPEGPPGVKLDESPYRRLLQLRDRLSDKYAGGAHGPGEINGVPPHGGHVYDYARSLDVDRVESMLQPAARRPDARELQQVESRVLELQEKELSFQRMKEDYQKQLQQQYETQQREHEKNSKASAPRSPPMQARATHATQQQQQQYHSGVPTAPAPGPVAQNLFYHSVALPPVPPSPPQPKSPPPAGYDVLYDLIQRRRQVLENITQPSEFSPQRTTQPSGQGIFDAISNLKQRQTASVDVIHSMTRERTVPAEPVRGSLAQVTLQTPALHPSIQNYMHMASSPPSASRGAAATSAGNNFLTRLTANNPYMQTMPTSGAPVYPPQPSASATYQPPPYEPAAAGKLDSQAAAGGGAYYTTPSVRPFVPQPSPAPQVNPSMSARPPLPQRSASPRNRAPSPRRPPPAPAATASSSNLSQAIRDLQSKQAQDLRRLRSF